MCQQAKFLLSDSGDSDNPAGSVRVMGDVTWWHAKDSAMWNFLNMWCVDLECPVLSGTIIT